MAKERKDRRVDFMMSPSEVRAVDEWRATQEGVPGRSEALRRLVRLGLAASPHSEIFADECRRYLDASDPEDRDRIKPTVLQLLADAAGKNDEIKTKVEHAVFDAVGREVMDRAPRRKGNTARPKKLR
jgi:hypothetical protein